MNKADTILSEQSRYDAIRKDFTWPDARRELQGLADGGINIAHEAVVRHANSSLRHKTALKWIRKDRSHQDFSFAELEKYSSRFANVLSALGIQKGQPVFSLLGRVPELYFTAIGTLKNVSVFCPLFSVFGPEPLFQRLSRGEAVLLVTTRLQYEKKILQLAGKLPLLKYIVLVDAPEHISENVLSWRRLIDKASDVFAIPDTRPEDPALLHFTSGTTGMPKGALHVHNAVLMHYVTGKYVLDLVPGDIFWCTADPGWVTGTSYGILAPLVCGVTTIADEEEFDAARWYSVLEEHKVSVWYTAPTAIRRLMRMDPILRSGYALDHLRLVLSVGEPLHADAVAWGEKNFGVPVLDNWWQTETGGIMITNYPFMKVKHGSMGKPLPGVEAAIAEISDDQFRILNEPGVQGHLVLKQGWPSMFRAYVHEEERYKKCFRNEWYMTGDLAKRDSDGYFWFVGRADDIIKTSGHMVGPFEVESCLMEHAAVAEAAVIGKPDPLIGEMVKAFIVLKTGYHPTENIQQDIMAFARKKLGAAVAPKEIAFIENLPKTRSGKVLRRLLKARESGLPEGDISTLENA